MKNIKKVRKLEFFLTLIIILFSINNVHSQYHPNIEDPKIYKNRFQNISLEMSLKPFKINNKAYIKGVAEEVFTQWHALLRHTDTVLVMLWTSDGSEILDYKGDPQQELEWAKYMGNPNTEHEVGSGPVELSIHERAYLYNDNPAEFTYEDLKFIVHILKEAGRRITGKPILVGTTFDPGPEFAKSDFKYKKHPEILGGNAMGHKTFVSCYSILNADNDSYAGFPNGIPDKTPFGTFFGRQSQAFMSDMGFDFIWFSNGFGFGAEGWSATGALFDGKSFDQDRLEELTSKIHDFWVLFRKECPDFQIQTRGTNLSVGADLARDAVDLRSIYNGNFNMLPPPNSPWAALDGDFGLELVGYLSRMAELPDNRFPFRYYTHDPWWLNSPWLDRYGREPHDIYLPLAVSRIDKNGNVGIPTQLNFLTIDDTYGNMPVQVPNEVTPHILKARMDSPTSPGPIVWIYPFDEYHEWAYNDKSRLPEIYYGDWFMRQAINTSFPLNTVISTTSFNSLIKKNPEYFKESVLITIAPDAGSDIENSIISHVMNGGKVIIYGPVDHSSEKFSNFINIQNVEPIEGIFKITTDYPIDIVSVPYSTVINHRSLISAGGLRTIIKNPKDKHTKKLVVYGKGNSRRDVAWTVENPDWHGGKIGYFRGTNSSSFTGGRLLTSDNPLEFFIGPIHLRSLLNEFGIFIAVEKVTPSQKNPVLTISRSNNAFIFSGYNPNNTIALKLRLPQGAPVLTGLESRLHEGNSSYTMPTAWNRECRIFIEQESGLVTCNELHSGQKDITKRYQVTGLVNATVRIYPENHAFTSGFNALMNSGYPWRQGKVPFSFKDDNLGKHFVVENVTGNIVFSW